MKFQPFTPVLYQGRRAWVLPESTEDCAALAVIDLPGGTFQAVWADVEAKRSRNGRTASDSMTTADRDECQRIRRELLAIAGICVDLLRNMEK